MMEHTESPSSRSSVVDESIETLDKSALKVERDYYVVLEVPANASGEHIGVSFNRIYNQMIALQHSGPQTEEAAASFRELTEAYEVLRDPVKRRNYDKRNQPSPPAQSESIVGRAFGAIVSRFGAPTTSTTASSSGVAADVLDTVGILCQQGGIEGKGPPMDPRVGEIFWGVGIEGKVDRQAACYYRLSVTSDDVDNGFIIHCKSASKDKFKVMMFESSGRLLHKEESSRSSDKQTTEATLFFVSYDVINPDMKITYQQSSPVQQPDSSYTNFGSGHEGDSNSSPTDKREIDREAPHSGISNRIDALLGPKKSVVAGQYLIAVYGDNIMVKTSFNLVAVMARNEASEVATIKKSGDQLHELSKELKVSEAEYRKCQDALYAAKKSLKRQEDTAFELIEARDKAYRGLIEASIDAYPASTSSAGTLEPILSTPVAPAPTLLGGLGSISLLGGGGSAPKKTVVAEGEHTDESKASARVAVAAAAASSAASSAATTASAAGGWLAKRFSEGVNQLQQRASKPPQQSTSGSGVKDHGSEAHGAAGDWPTLSPTPTLETRKPVEVGVIVPDRDSRVGGGDVKSQVAASDPAFDRFESLDISSTEGEAVKFSDSEEDTTSEPVVIQPLTR